jgi:hypothetical protein
MGEDSCKVLDAKKKIRFVRATGPCSISQKKDWQKLIWVVPTSKNIPLGSKKKQFFGVANSGLLLESGDAIPGLEWNSYIQG